MTIVSKRHRPIVIDLTGPEGNAFNLIGQMRSYGRQLGWSKVEIAEAVDEMMEGDYEHLVEVFDERLGHLITLER
jgi:hypothetical protein